MMTSLDTLYSYVFDNLLIRAGLATVDSIANLPDPLILAPQQADRIS